MEEEKFSPVGGESRSEGPKVKVITLLLFIIVVVVAIIIGKNYMVNQRKAEVKAAVVKVLEDIKAGDDITLEKYLKYDDLMNDTEVAKEDAEEVKSEDVETKDNEEDKKEANKDNSEEKSYDEENTKEDTNIVAEDATKENTNTVAENVTEENTNTIAEKSEEDLNKDNNDVAKTEEANNKESNSEENEMFKKLLANVNYEVKNVEVNGKTASVDVSITTKDAGQIFKNYFTRAIKLAITNTLSSSKYNGENVEKELEAYFEEQINSSEIGTVTNNIKFNLEERGGIWEITGEDKNLTDVVFPNLFNTIADLSETYGEYGD